MQHPFEVGHVFVNYNISHTSIIAAYQVVGKTARTLLLQELQLDEKRRPRPGVFVEGSKPFRRTPLISWIDSAWQLPYDDRFLYAYLVQGTV